MQCVTACCCVLQCSQLQCVAVCWVPCDYLGVHNQLSPVMKWGIIHQRKKERKKDTPRDKICLGKCHSMCDSPNGAAQTPEINSMFRYTFELAALFFIVCYNVLQCVTACCSVLQRVAVCCSVPNYSVLQHVVSPMTNWVLTTRVAVCCSVLQCVVVSPTTVCCSVLGLP